MVQIHFRADSNQLKREFEPLPPNYYKVMVVDSQLKQDSCGRQFLQIAFRVIEPPFMGRYIWGRYYFDHPDERVVNISKEQLSRLCGALDISGFSDTTELHNRQLVLRLDIRQTANGKCVNVIRSYERFEGGML